MGRSVLLSSFAPVLPGSRSPQSLSAPAPMQLHGSPAPVLSAGSLEDLDAGSQTSIGFFLLDPALMARLQISTAFAFDIHFRHYGRCIVVPGEEQD